ncbi:serine/threonine protein phosphatase [Candidatus Dependentiae bacterium]|nr:serine/threonine protein phosphatase [Candidatus Dependentiae bacterium]
MKNIIFGTWFLRQSLLAIVLFNGFNAVFCVQKPVRAFHVEPLDAPRIVKEEPVAALAGLPEPTPIKPILRPLLRQQQSEDSVATEYQPAAAPVALVPYEKGALQVTPHSFSSNAGTGEELEAAFDDDIYSDESRSSSPGFEIEECFTYDVDAGIFTSLESLADTFFHNVPEQVFLPGEKVNAYFEAQLRGKASVVPVEDIIKQFEDYFDVASLSHEPSLWLGGDQTTYARTAGEMHDFLQRNESFVEKNIVRADRTEQPPTVLFLGDLHGSAHGLIRSLLTMQRLGFLKDNFQLAPDVHVVFLGDMTDRGLFGIECLATILRLKNKNWKQVHLVRGNHENNRLAGEAGFFQELVSKFGNLVAGLDDTSMKTDELLKDYYMRFCSSLPSALFLGVYNNATGQVHFMQCCHGALAPHHDSSELLEAPSSVQFQKICYYAPHFGVQYEWNDVCCLQDAERLAGAGDAAVRAHLGMRPLSVIAALAGIPVAASRPLVPVAWRYNAWRGERKDLYILHRDDITKLLRAKGLFMLIRGHQDQEAPCKILRDDNVDPVSWRVHEAFNHITPLKLFQQGVALPDAPNCITLTNATEARALFSEGLFGITFKDDLQHSRVWLLEIDLLEHKEILNVLKVYKHYVRLSEELQPKIKHAFGKRFINAVESVVMKQRNGKYVAYKGLSRNILNGHTGSGEAAASPPLDDGSIPAEVTWEGEGSIAGIDYEAELGAFNPGMRYEPFLPALPCNFGRGNVREVMTGRIDSPKTK